ncbi:unnamed protein product [Nippostrongylus brasiliensis]|uniref:Uncharacterized protein n=1 Tax=Nippostrongylus brasiliensis TaxID=27835 RepID=A0A0N4XT65_NIPBR|nr:unnamed protein product [Nippostrongylus brasiliensis]
MTSARMCLFGSALDEALRESPSNTTPPRVRCSLMLVVVLLFKLLKLWEAEEVATAGLAEDATDKCSF